VITSGHGWPEQKGESKDSGSSAYVAGGAASVAGSVLVVVSPCDPGEALAAVSVRLVVAGTAWAGVPPGDD
jgi:hypothetical protein